MAESAPNEAVNRTLHVCPDCGSDLVQPTFWEQEPATAPTGGSGGAARSASGRGDSVHGETEIDAFDEQLDIGAHELSDELRALEHANMSEMVDAFVTALGNDLIAADDFAR